MPATDAGALVQLVSLLLALPVAVALLYRAGQRDIAQLVLGLGSLVAAWFGLRAVH